MIEFTEEQKMLRDMVRDFAENEVLPIAAEIDKEERFPAETIEKIAKLGLLGIPIPEEFGGAGLDTISTVIVVEELAKVCASTAITVDAHITLGTMPILNFGTEQQKNKYLPALASGKYLGAFGLTEPSGGSDAGNCKTTAVLNGDEWILNGSKVFITNANYSGTFVVTAKTQNQAGDSIISAFVVERENPGLSIGKSEKKMGWRGSDTRQIFLDNARVPKENLLGDPNHGFSQFLSILDTGRICIAALANGITHAALKEALKYTQERVAFGKPIYKFQGVQFPLAKIATKLHASRLMTYSVAKKDDAKENVTKEAAMAKLFASELAMKATTQAIQALGGFGYCREYPVERYFRDAKVLEIGEGTSEVQQLVIARKLLEEFG